MAKLQAASVPTAAARLGLGQTDGQIAVLLNDHRLRLWHIYVSKHTERAKYSKVVSKKSCVPPAETVPDDDPDEDGEDDGREWDATWRTDVQLSVWCSEPDLGRLGGRDDVDELTSTTKRVATPTTFRLSAVPPSSSVVEGLRAPTRSHTRLTALVRYYPGEPVQER